MAVTGPLIAAGGLWFAGATYMHTVEHDREQETAAISSASTRPPTALPNLSTKPVEKSLEKEAEKPSEQAEQKPPVLPPVEIPKEPVKEEEPKPFNFWGYFPVGQGQTVPPGIMFQVRSCAISRTLVSCIMTATSPHYDRDLSFNGSTTTVTDSEGDMFRVQLHSFSPLQLDRDSPVPFKLEFPVNKDLVKPAVVRLNGFSYSSGTLQNAAFRIGGP